MSLNEKIIELGNRVKKGEMTWKLAAEEINSAYGECLSGDAVRKRYKTRIKKAGVDVDTKIDESKREYTTEFGDGTIEAQKVVEYNKEIFGDKKKLLKYLGYNADEWEFVFVTTSVWQQHTKEQTTKELYAVKFKVKPVVKGLSLEKSLEAAKEVFNAGIAPIKFKKEAKKKLNPNRLMEIPAIELHLGKYAEELEVGSDYNSEIAKGRFYHILEEIVHQQEQEMCDKALVMIGNDFFNSDTVNGTTTKGTPQSNDIRWKSMFILGLELYKDFFMTLRTHFNKIDVRLCQGNHDTMSSFYLYMALSAYFRLDNVIEFSDNYREYQCYRFGDNAIFFGHGDGNFKRIVQSIPAEFYKEWGESKYRELHLGHLHSQFAVDENSGLITRRIGSPTMPDAWHYGERFIGAVPSHQVFVWDAESGLNSIKYITFDKILKKQLTNNK